MVHRPYFQIRRHYGFGNALLLTGNQHYAVAAQRLGK
jgi:hypothetical protein